MNEEPNHDDGSPEDAPPVLHAVPAEEANLSSANVDLDHLAASARDIADFIAGHATAVREYERRIVELEGELATIRATTAEAKTQLAAVLQLVDVLKPSA